MRIGNEFRVNQGTETQTTEDSVTVLYKKTYAKTVIGAVTINLVSSLTETILGPVSKKWTSTFTHIVGGVWNATTASVIWLVNGLFTFK